MSSIWAYCFNSIGSSRKGWLLSKSKSSLYQSSGPIALTGLILLVQLRSLSLLSLLLFNVDMLIYSGWSRLGEVHEMDRDRDLTCSDLVLCDLLLSLLEFLDLADCWDLVRFLDCLGSPISVGKDKTK